LLIGSAAATIGRHPIARIIGRDAMALDPKEFGYAPVEAANRALARAGITRNEVRAVEFNEAFAVQSLAGVDVSLALGLRDAELVNQRVALSRSATRWAAPAGGYSLRWRRS